MTSASRLPHSSLATVGTLLVAVALIATACGSAARPTAYQSSDRDGAVDVAVAPANFDLVVDPAARFLVGLFTGEKDNIGYGALRLVFTYNGTDGKASEPGPVADSEFLLLPDSATRQPPIGPAKLDLDEGRGV